MSGKQYTAYIKDEDDIEWIDRISDDVFDSTNQVFRKAVKIMREERGQEIEALMTEDDETSIL